MKTIENLANILLGTLILLTWIALILTASYVVVYFLYHATECIHYWWGQNLSIGWGCE